MEVIILKKFDSREVGTTIDLEESIAKELIKKGILSDNLEKEVKTIKKEKKNEKNS